jgi:aryl-alcohol dehydrogenase-like predicted oxidoreductase
VVVLEKELLLTFHTQHTRPPTPTPTQQVQYSLLYRVPEQNDVLAATSAAGASLIAYSPLAQGLLTGKFSEDGPFPSGPRAATITPARVKAVAPLIALMRAVGAEHASGGGGPKTPTQVALAWCVAKGTLPIPGVKNARQAGDAAGALGLVLTGPEVEELDAVSGRIAPGLAFPTEKW